MPKIIKRACVGLLLLLLPKNLAAFDKNPIKEGLEADEVQQIQAVSQAVLKAKKNITPDPDMQTLRQQVTALQQAIVSLADTSSVQVKDSSLPSQTDEKISAGSAPDQQQAKRQERENNLRKVINEVRRQRTLVQFKSQDETGEYASMKSTAAAKLAELENDTDELLNSRPEERAEKISRLKERLSASHLPFVSQPDTAEQDTPTISTIVRHREQ